MPRRPIPICLLLAAALLLAGPLRAQQAPADEESPRDVFFEAVDVEVVNVEVYVTDREGRRVAGLGRDDFEVLEDGRPVQITNFYAVEGGRRADDDDGAGDAAEPGVDPDAEAGAAPPLPDPRLPGPPVPEEQRLHLVLYFDNLNLRPFDRNRVIHETRAFLQRTVRPGDRVMLVTADRSLQVRQPFTEDLRLIHRALDEVEAVSGFAVQRDTERQGVVRAIQQADTWEDAEPQVDLYAKSLYNDVEVSLRLIQEVVGSLGGLPGRKALFHVSNGLAMTAGAELFHLLDERFARGASRLQANRYQKRRDFRELAAKANANRVTFYTLDAAGLSARSSISAEHGGTSGSLVEMDFVHDANRQEPLELLAEDTGGQSVLNTSNFAGALERIGQDFGTYYSLGYSPATAGDGRYHTIEVRLKERRRGLQVRHREGYRAKSASTRLAEGNLASLLHGAERNPLGVRVVTGTPRRNDQGRFLVPLEVAIPLGSLALVPHRDVHSARLLVAVTVMDGEGETSPPTLTPVPLDIPAAEVETARRQHFTYEAELLMRPGRHRVAVAVRDEVGGETSFVQEPVVVQPR
ncbi:MAG TPA: VWA domain-containing protein [Thermoanaerobaculia bacterium]|nr:VWA domain-containing protein [Thermoanaerobaculia bacterium]